MPAPAPMDLSRIGTSSGSLVPRSFGVALLPSPGAAGSSVNRHQFWELGAPEFRGRINPRPGAAGSFVNRHQFWELGVPKFRGRINPRPGAAGSFVNRHQFWWLCAPKFRGRGASQPRRRCVCRESAPVLVAWRPEISGSH